MKKGNLPTQEYELINVCMQTIEKYEFSVYKYDNGKEFCINLTFKKDFGGYKKGYSGGYTAAMSLDKLPLFSEFVKAPQG